MTGWRIPLIPTLLVLTAVAVMIRLGFWQLDRLHQKEAMLAQFGSAAAVSGDVPLVADSTARGKQWFRHTRFACVADGPTRPMAGHNAAGVSGWAQWADCKRADGMPIAVNIGWSQTPAPVHFAGGEIGGVIAPDGAGGARVVSDTPAKGLILSARPDPRDISNNHLSYAVQWFLFAATALVIYALALRKRLAA